MSVSNLPFLSIQSINCNVEILSRALRRREKSPVQHILRKINSYKRRIIPCFLVAWRISFFLRLNKIFFYYFFLLLGGCEAVIRQQPCRSYQINLDRFSVLHTACICQTIFPLFLAHIFVPRSAQIIVKWFIRSSWCQFVF